MTMTKGFFMPWTKMYQYMFEYLSINKSESIENFKALKDHFWSKKEFESFETYKTYKKPRYKIIKQISNPISGNKIGNQVM